MGKIDAESCETASANMRKPLRVLSRSVLFSSRKTRLRRVVRTCKRVGSVWTSTASQRAVCHRAPREVERPVVPLPLQQLLVRPGFGDAAVHEDDDLRVPWDRVVPMRGEDDDLVRQLREELEDRALALRIQ